MANGVRPDAVIDLGCGLGEILARIRAPYRHGFDIDEGAIAAARHLHGKHCHFSLAGLGDTARISASFKHGGGSTLMVMVNWPHSVAEEALIDGVTQLSDSVGLKYLLIDGIHAGTLGYSYYHDDAVYSRLGKTLQRAEGADGVRSLYLIELAPKRSLQ
ncbi:MAG: hypothetical protein ACKOYJ_03495 [Planctomycetia bacterium]